MFNDNSHAAKKKGQEVKERLKRPKEKTLFEFLKVFSKESKRALHRFKVDNHMETLKVWTKKITVKKLQQ